MDHPFFENGLQFECTRCSQCCRFDPGYVFLSQADLDRMVAHMQLSEHDFLLKYCRIVEINAFKRVSLQEKTNFDCIFWEEGGCRIYEARPLQCRSYPFWSPYLSDRAAWDELESSCPGVNKGETHSREEIDNWLKMRLDEPIIEIP